MDALVTSARRVVIAWTMLFKSVSVKCKCWYVPVVSVEEYRNMKHTPGPWIISPRKCRYKIDNEELVEICSANGFATSFEALGITDRETQSKTLAIIPLDNSNEANALIISAAPELLEALKLVLSVADRKTHEFDAARKAIAKAEGIK